MIGPQWHLTYGGAAAILLGGGIGAIVGALAGEALGDLWGRKALVVVGTFICALGVVPVLIGVGTLLVVPESARWLTAKGRFAEARAAVAKLLHLPLSQVPLPAATPAAPPRASLAELYARPGLFWLVLLAWTGAATAAYGMSLWGPTIIAQLMHIQVKQAAHFFVYISAAGILGKVLFSFAAPLFGRRRLGQIHGFATFLALAAAAYFHSVLLGGISIFSIFVVALAATDFFNAGGFSNLAPYTPEAYGVRMGSRASGLGQGANGAGKIIGPLSLAVIAGTGNVLKPAATAAAVFPAFMFLACCGLVIGLAFTFLAHETHGQPVPQDAGAVPGVVPVRTATGSGAG